MSRAYFHSATIANIGASPNQIKMVAMQESNGYKDLKSRYIKWEKSLPNEKSTSLAATATAAPLEDPPGILWGTAGFVGVP